MEQAITGPRLEMQIAVVANVGHGSTLLSSFDDALRRCGVYNYNLIPLSSVIPPNTRIVQDAFAAPEDEFGHRLYVVKAEARSDEPGRAVAAGIGWYQWADGRGVFVEHELVGDDIHETGEEVCSLIHASLRDLCIAREVLFDHDRVCSRLIVSEVGDTPTTALVLAVYRSEPWS